MWETGEHGGTPKIAGPLELDGLSLTLDAVRDVAVCGRKVRLAEPARIAVKEGRRQLDALVDQGGTLYGINTGFGELASVAIPREELSDLQKNLVRSHAVGVGEPLEAAQVRAVLLLRANALASGPSGVRPKVIDALLDFLEAGLHPVVPSQGSVGSSGDLAPLAHVALALMGEGQLLGEDGSGSRSAADAMGEAGLEPLCLEMKEGLALLNGTQVMLALGIEAWLRGRLCAKTADVLGAMSLQPLMGTCRAFDERLMELRPHVGACDSAANLRRLLERSPMIDHHAHCSRVQDAYSLRGMPVVHGATRTALRHVGEVLETEVNSVTDNPVIIGGQAISGANFHGQPVALVLDYLAIALAELGSIGERRVERLVNPHYSEGLPGFLVRRGGLNSGFMVVQYTAAALVSENKGLAFPASVDSIPTSAGKEDHVSMGMIAARQALAVARNLEWIQAIELLCACQAIDLRAPLELSEATKEVHRLVRSVVPFANSDRWFQPDIEAARKLIASGAVLKAAERVVGNLL